MNTDFYYRKKIPVAILGVTGLVGQRFVKLLADHPWFTIESIAASEGSVGQLYGDVVNWQVSTPLPESIAKMRIRKCEPTLDCAIAFSALPSEVAGAIEADFARAGVAVVSNSRAHRMDPDVPLVIPEINPRHLKLVKQQTYSDHGCIVTNPNCVVIGLVMALKPLYDQFGIEAVQVSTMQAISGAGNIKKTRLDVDDNVIPYIADEEAKVETEPLKILGNLPGKTVEFADFRISAQCNRVPVSDGHMENVAVRLKKPASRQDIIDLWTSFKGEPQGLALPSAPKSPIYYFHEDTHPQPREHRDLERGMAVSIGRLQECKNFDWKFTVLSNNVIRGAAGCALLNAELMVKQGLIFW